MLLQFFKYQGTGNDFILLDNRQADIHLSNESIARLCDRRFGVGADGLMLLESCADADFRMVYYNADGGESTMCGNGGRCIAAFAKRLGIIDKKASFLAIDGRHDADIADGDYDGLTVRLNMNDVLGIDQNAERAVLDTGSPHYVRWMDDIAKVQVVEEGRRIRNSTPFAAKGINVNFAKQLEGNFLEVRTYERGVEDETLSCGTGVTAAAVAASGVGTGAFQYTVHTPGGMLEVSFFKTAPNAATDVVLAGPAAFVFSGQIQLT